MKGRNFTLVLAAALAVSLTAVTPGFSASDRPETTTKKMTRQQQTAPPSQSGYVGGTPNSCDYDRAAGRCVIDLGYGRCVECNVGPR